MPKAKIPKTKESHWKVKVLRARSLKAKMPINKKAKIPKQKKAPEKQKFWRQKASKQKANKQESLNFQIKKP